MVGSQAVPVYLAWGLLGVLVGGLAVVAVTGLTGYSMLIAFGLVPIAGTTFVAMGHIGRRLFGRERHSLMLDLYAVLGVCALALWAIGQPVLAYLDRALVGLAVFLVFGRLGCATAGCCHGVRASFGFAYPHEQRPGKPRVYRLPVQLIEVAIWLLVAAVAAAQVLFAAPGQALGTGLVLYGLARFALESVRGDVRPRWLGVTEARWLALVGIPVGLGLYRPVHCWTLGEIVMAGVGVALFTVMYATRTRWLSLPPPLGERDATDAVEVGARLRDTPLDESPGSWALGPVTIAASAHHKAGRTLTTLSVSRSEVPLTRVEAEHLLAQVIVGMGAPYHLSTVANAGVLESQSGLYVTFLDGLPDSLARAPAPPDATRSPAATDTELGPGPAAEPDYFEPRSPTSPTGADRPTGTSERASSLSRRSEAPG